MDGLNPNIEENQNLDFLIPEGGPGQEAANFSAKVQKDQFLGGGSGNRNEISSNITRRILDAETFRQTQTRIEKSRRIREDLQGDNPQKRERIEEIRNIEAQSKQGEEAKQTGFEEIVLDTKGYQEKRLAMMFTTPDGKQSISEELIAFVKTGENNQLEYLKTSDGRIPFLNADLYNSRITSHLHDEGMDYDVKAIPRVDGRGAYTGVVSIIESKDTGLKTPQAQQEQSKAPTQELDSQQQKAQGAEQFFGGIAKGLKESREAKVAEYKGRIEAVLRGEELHKGDKSYLDQMRLDYLRLGGQKFWK